MKLIDPRQVPWEYIERMRELSPPRYNFNPTLRNIVREYVRRILQEDMGGIVPNINNSKIKLERRNYKPYELCVFCGRILHKPKKPYKHREYKITELRPCCYCFNKYKGKMLHELPKNIRENIKKNLKKQFEII